jgi:PAS domain S-box-containing protein
MNVDSFDEQRLEALTVLKIFDTKPEAGFDAVTELTASLFEVPICVVSLIDKDRQWFKSCVGLGVNETPRDVAFCDFAIRRDEVMIVPDAEVDPRFINNTLVTGDPNIRFYAGAPLRYNGVLIGTLCIIDTKTRFDFSHSQAQQLQKLADIVSTLLVTREQSLTNEAALRVIAEAQVKLEMMEEVAGVGYWHVGLKDNTLEWSQGVYAIHGTSRELYTPVLGTAIDWYVPEDRLKVVAALDYAVEAKQTFQFEHSILRGDGQVRRVICIGRASFDALGEPEGIFGVFQDVTDRRDYEDALHEAKLNAETFAQAKADFLSNMSHEIRTPLTTILGYGTLLEQVEGLNDEAKLFTQRIGRAGKALLSLVNDVLDYAKLDSGLMILDPQPTDIRKLVTEITDQFSNMAQSKGLKLSSSFCSQIPPSLEIDDVRLRQVLTNIVGNACKFTQSGSISVAIEMIADNGSAPKLSINITDTGCGLSEDQLSHLFKRFHQASQGINRKHGGSGLGLAISQEIIALMNGNISVESTLGKGSAFKIEVPVKASLLALAEVDLLQPLNVDLMGKTILLVDDHQINREMIRILLKSSHANVFEASDGTEAVRKCMKRSFDLILMDIQMPVLDGISAAQTIRSQCPLNQDAPIIALSAFNSQKLTPEIESQLFNGFLTKPIEVEALFKSMNDIFQFEANIPAKDRKVS